MYKSIKLSMIVAFLLTINTVKGQKTDQPNPELGWHFGLNTGMLLPYGKPAGFYSGSAQNENRISLILDNTYYKTQIVQHIGYNYTGYELPQNMGYKPNFGVGFFVRYQFSGFSSIFVETSYSRLTASDIFLLQLDVPQGYSFDPTYLECKIMGQEERTYLNFGYRYDFPSDNIGHLFGETGFSMNNVKVLKNMFKINNLEYSIKYSGEHPTGPYSQDPRYDFYQGGVGVGGFFNVGTHFRFNDNVSIQPLLGVNYSTTQLEGYNSPGPTWYFCFRFNFRSLAF